MDRNLIILPDGTEIFSGAGLTNAIKSCQHTEIVNSETELTIGSVCAACLEVSIIAPGGTLSIDQGTEITYYRVDDTGERTKVGLFTCEKPTRSGNIYKFTAYDRVTWLDVDLTDWLSGLSGWPYTLLDFAGMICEQCGLTLTNTSLINGDYEIQQFTASVTGRQLMQWVGQICARFCRSTVDGDIEYAWYTATGQTILPSGSNAYFAGSFSYEDFQTAPMDKVQIKNGDSDVGVIYPADATGTNAYVIDSNPLITSSSNDAVSPVAKAIYKALEGVTYTPCKVSIRANSAFHAGDIIQVVDSNGNTVTTYVMSRKQAGQKVTLESTGSASRDSVTATNSTTLSSLNGKVLNIESTIDGLKIKNADQDVKYAALSLTVDGISSTVSSQGGTIAEIQESVDSIEMSVTETESNYSALTLKVDGISGTVSSVEKTLSDVQEAVLGTITNVEVQYALGTSTETAPTSGWSTTAPEWEDGKYMWQKTVTTYSSGTVQESDPTCIAGATGATGEKGDAGVGVVSVEISYQVGTDGAAAPTGTWTSAIPTAAQGQYLWTRTVWTYSNGTSETMYSVSRSGTDGEDGTSVKILGTAYTAETEYAAGQSYVLYSDSGLVTEITDAEAGDSYLVGGYLFVYSENDGMFICTGVIRGEDGTGIVSIVNYYLATSASSGVTTGTSGWTTTPQSVSADAPYLWNYEITALSDGNSDITTPCIIGVYGDTGVGISTITERYAVSASSTTVPTSWSTSVPSMSATNKYLWNYEIITYTDGSISSTAKRVIGVYGDTGWAGVGIASIVPQYYLSSSDTECADGEWSDTMPTWADGYYIWTRSYITWDDGTTSTTSPVLAGAINSANESAAQAVTISTETAAKVEILDESITLEVTRATTAEGTLSAADTKYGTCSTSAATATKAVTCSTFTSESLVAGATICVYFTYANTAAYPFLNVNSTGSKLIYAYGAPIASGSPYNWTANSYVTFVYNGSYWCMVDASASSKIALLADSISLSVTGSLGSTASIVLSVDGAETENSIDLSGVRNAFAADTSAITISAGTVTFDSNTFVVNSTNFSVTASGVLTATAGTIGGWTITNNKLYTGDGDTVGVCVVQAPTENTTWVFAAGGTTHTTYTDCPFRVSKAGKLYATDAVISGQITASSGTIGNWNISLSDSASSSTSANGGHAYASGIWGHSSDGTYEYETGMKTGSASTDLAFYVKRITSGGTWASTTNLFYVNHQGKLYATNAEITGKITATSGSFTGTVNATDGSFTGSITTSSGTIGGFTIGSSYIAAGGATTLDNSVQSSVYIGEYGINIGGGVLKVDVTNDTQGQISSNAFTFNIDNTSGYFAGYMGIGGTTTSSSYKLYISGATYSTSYISSLYHIVRPTATTTVILRPNISGYGYIGSSSYKFNAVYASTSTIQTSDRKLKTNIQELPQKYLELFLRLIPVSYQMKDGTSGRTHIGFIAQDVEDAMADLGIDSLEFAGFCKAQDYEITGVDEDGNEICEYKFDEDGNPVYNYFLRYEEFIAINTAAIQTLWQKVAALESAIN